GAARQRLPGAERAGRHRPDGDRPVAGRGAAHPGGNARPGAVRGAGDGAAGGGGGGRGGLAGGRGVGGRWWLFVCGGAPESKHWWIEVLEADDPAGVETAEARPAFPGDERPAGKEPIGTLRHRRWHARRCCHPPDPPAAEDRRSSAYATSADGWTWDWHGPVLSARPGRWD